MSEIRDDMHANFYRGLISPYVPIFVGNGGPVAMDTGLVEQFCWCHDPMVLGCYQYTKYHKILWGSISKLVWCLARITLKLFKLLCLAKDHWRGSVPKLRIWSILLMKSDLKLWIHLSRSLFIYSVTCVRMLWVGYPLFSSYLKDISSLWWHKKQ